MITRRLLSRPPSPAEGSARPAFTTMEVMVALGLLTLAMVTLTQVAVFALAERRQQSCRLEVMEVAANILESARLQTPDALTPQWAATQKLPAGLADRLLDPKLTVDVQAYGPTPRLKKVTVRATWLLARGQLAPPVVLEGFFGPHVLASAEAKP